MAAPLTDSTPPPVQLRWPRWSLLALPPSPLPAALPPPNEAPTLAQPFAIPPALYTELLSVKYPLAIALLYAAAVYYLNELNRRRGYRPWRVSRSKAFVRVVIAHNALLAAYSLWTFVGMLRAVAIAWPGWRALRQPGGGAILVDAFCKLHGPRGLGSAAAFRPGESAWRIDNRAFKLLGGAVPDPSDVGRIWNAGLAFYGWLFYLSKFYEVLDTLVILAKGKMSTFLQTYHHAGAMFGMWAGIRYMSPPIWMFVTFNSGIHTLMYTYYALTALSIKIPRPLKKFLTRLQIAQFVVGASYAVLHLFIAYRSPVELPYRVVRNLSTALPTATSLATSAATAASSSLVSATASADFAAWARTMALRAAGVEQLAGSARRPQSPASPPPHVLGLPHLPIPSSAVPETRYRAALTSVDCIDTSGEAFAITLNVMYLAPLTYLFVSFFVKSYSRQARFAPSAGEGGEKGKGGARTWSPEAVGRSGLDAVKRVEKEVLRAMSKDRGSARASAAASEASSEAENGAPRRKGLEMTSAMEEPEEEEEPSNVSEQEGRAEADGERAATDEERVASKEEEKGGDEAEVERRNVDEPDQKDGKADFAQFAASAEKRGTGNAEAYEANVEEVMSGEEKKAEAATQGVDESAVLVDSEAKGEAKDADTTGGKPE